MEIVESFSLQFTLSLRSWIRCKLLWRVTASAAFDDVEFDELSASANCDSCTGSFLIRTVSKCFPDIFLFFTQFLQYFQLSPTHENKTRLWLQTKRFFQWKITNRFESRVNFKLNKKNYILFHLNFSFFSAGGKLSKLHRHRNDFCFDTSISHRRLLNDSATVT